MAKKSLKTGVKSAKKSLKTGVRSTKKSLKEGVCVAPDGKGKRCTNPISVKKFKLCGKHYQQVYHHGKVTNNPRGPKSTLRKKAETLYKNYRGRDAMRDIKKALVNQGEDPEKVRKVVWHVVRGSNKKAR